MQKIRPIREVANQLGGPTAARAKVVQCHGVFDLLHIGHIRHLQEARELGDRLVVTITPDRFVNKGPHRPAFSAELRAEALAALECVDFVCINEWPTAVEAINLLRPDVFMKGSVKGKGPRDRNNAIDLECEAIDKVGGRMVLSDTELSSASALINRHTDVFSPELKSFLQEFRTHHSAQQLVLALTRLEDLRVLVVGESYVEATTLQIEGVPPNLDRASERYAGGAMAVANALSRFSDRVAVLTAGIGDEVSAGFLSKNAASGIEVEIVDAPEGSSPEVEPLLDRMLDRHDVVLLTDHGTGFVSENARATIRARAKFFAIDVRDSDSRARFTGVGRGADLVVLNQAGNEANSTTASDLADSFKAATVLLIRACATTHAAPATIVYDAATDSCSEAPAFPVNAANREDVLGTREALFGLSASCCALGLDAAAIAFVGNLATAAATTVAGSGRALDPQLIYRHIDSLLK